MINTGRLVLNNPYLTLSNQMLFVVVVIFSDFKEHEHLGVAQQSPDSNMI